MSTFAMTAPQLGEQFNITPRRVRQYVEDGHLPRLGRGLFDLGWLAHLRAGEAACAQMHRKPAAPTLVALSWLLASGERATQDRALLIALFGRNGKSSDDALEALGEARALVAR